MIAKCAYRLISIRTRCCNGFGLDGVLMLVLSGLNIYENSLHVLHTSGRGGLLYLST